MFATESCVNSFSFCFFFPCRRDCFFRNELILFTAIGFLAIKRFLVLPKSRRMMAMADIVLLTCAIIFKKNSINELPLNSWTLGWIATLNQVYSWIIRGEMAIRGIIHNLKLHFYAKISKFRSIQTDGKYKAPKCQSIWLKLYAPKKSENRSRTPSDANTQTNTLNTSWII